MHYRQRVKIRAFTASMQNTSGAKMADPVAYRGSLARIVKRPVLAPDIIYEQVNDSQRPCLPV